MLFKLKTTSLLLLLLLLKNRLDHRDRLNISAALKELSRSLAVRLGLVVVLGIRGLIITFSGEVEE